MSTRQLEIMSRRLGLTRKNKADPAQVRKVGTGAVRPRQSAVKALLRMVDVASQREAVKLEAQKDSERDGKYLSTTKRDPKKAVKEATRALARAMQEAHGEGVPYTALLAVLEGRKLKPTNADEAFAAIISSISRDISPEYCETALTDAFAKQVKNVLKTVVYLREKDEEKVAAVAEALQHLGKVVDLGYDERTGTRLLRIESEIEQRHLTPGDKRGDWHKDDDPGTKTPQSTQDAGAGTKTGIRDKSSAERRSASHIAGKSSQSGTRGAAESMAGSIANLVENLKSRSDLADFRGVQLADPKNVIERLRKLVDEKQWRSSSKERKAALLHKAYEEADVITPVNTRFMQVVRQGKLLEFDDDDEMPYSDDEPPEHDHSDIGGEPSGATAGDTVELPTGGVGVVAGVEGDTATVSTVDLDVTEVPVADLKVIDAPEMEEPPGEADLDRKPPSPDNEMGDDDEFPFESVDEDDPDYLTTHDTGDVIPMDDPDEIEDRRQDRTDEDGTQTGTGAPANAKRGTGIPHHDTDLGEPGTNDIFDIEGREYSSGTDTAREMPQDEPGSSNAPVHRKGDDSPAYEAVLPSQVDSILLSLNGFEETLSSANSMLGTHGFDNISDPEYRRVLELHKAGYLPDKIMDQVEIPREAIELLVSAEADGPNRGTSHADEPNLVGSPTRGLSTSGPQGS